LNTWYVNIPRDQFYVEVEPTLGSPGSHEQDRDEQGMTELTTIR
jgi:hypothetical protein